MRLVLPYTICFIRYEELVLMLHRSHPPNAGLWNGVGGKLEPGETPLDGVLREVREETGIHLPTARFGGIVTWSEGWSQPDGQKVTPPAGRRGMYAYVAHLPPDVAPEEVAPRDTREGRLEWLSPHQFRRLPLVTNIAHFLPPMFGDEAPCEFHCDYRAGHLLSVTRLPLPAAVAI